MKLDEGDQHLLALLGTQPRSVATLGATVDSAPADLEARLDELADNGLVTATGDGEYQRTESGRRVLVSSSSGTLDERLDTTPAVEAALAAFDLRADEADAVRHAFTFLRYWGQVTEAEFLDAIYSEAPAGRESPDQWWVGVVREPLASLPGVAPPDADGEPWRYTDRPEAADPAADGRRILSKTHPVYGDVKHALESLGLPDEERAAVSAAFEYLYRRETATEADIREDVFSRYPAGYTDAEEWWEAVVSEAFEQLPKVDQTDGTTWRYRHA